MVGGELTYAPKNKLTLTTTYQAPLDERFGDLSLSATYTHVDKQIANANSPLGILPATDLLNLNLNWNDMFGRPIDLGLFVTNVTKEKYPVAIGGTWASAGFESLILGEPRMYGARLRVRFGT
ncbi:TonB-dependent receptor [Phenylobacterium sp. LjRoot219]|uniref:hypothetical protein n=1 Tax=Phenylobacterium sp. LjRoot219 TaxID=3342283 RepID=UPI003ECD9BC7